MTLEPGDRLYLYSDGLLEQRQSRDEQFGPARLLQAFADRTNGALEDVVTHVVDELTRWAEGTTFEDDVSIVAVEWTGAP